MATRVGEPVRDLTEALHVLRAEVMGSAYPLPLPSADGARAAAAATLAQLDDYLLPRLSRPDAPLLAVVGGSTGAGKSTLVNSLVRAPVSPVGILRPTTRAPTLVCHPADSPWFRRGSLLPGLVRTSSPGTDPHQLHVVVAPALTPGVAFLDAPDIDSIGDGHPELAARLLAAADMWLFVTTAARYGDATPWRLLSTARERGTVVALALARVRADAVGEITTHLTEMLAQRGLAGTPLFVVPEVWVNGQGLLAESVTAGLRSWFGALAADGATRAAMIRRTLTGALDALPPVLTRLAVAADAQVAAAETLAEGVGMAYGTARSALESTVRDGSLIRGEVLTRWREFARSDRWIRMVREAVGRRQERATAAATGRPAVVRDLSAALEAAVVALIFSVAANAAEQANTAWRRHPAGAALLTPEFAQPSPELESRTAAAVQEWRQGVFDLARGGRATGRGSDNVAHAAALMVMVGAVAGTAGPPAWDAAFDDHAVRAFTTAREDLVDRLGALLDTEVARYLDRLAAMPLAADTGHRLRAAARQVAQAHATTAFGHAGRAQPAGGTDIST